MIHEYCEFEMSDKYPDSYHKMSKKIAQLTKVIFHLHTRNEENEEFVKALKRSYEREIDGIVRDANGIVARQKEALQAQREAGDATAKLREQQEKHDLEKKQTLAELERYKQQVGEREARLVAEKDDTLKRLKDSVDALRNQYESKLKALTAQLKNGDNLKKAIDELKRVHQAEIENHVKENNRKYNDLLKEKLLNEDRLIEIAEK